MVLETIKKYAERVWKLRRDLVSDGFDEALRILSEWVPLEICAYPSRSECFTWIVPDKWTCHRAELRDPRGNVLFSDRDHPLHCVSYSQPFKGRVSRQELFEHLHTDNLLPDAIPFRFFYYKKDWGLCCSARLKEQLTEEYYEVHIDSEFSPGELKVGEFRVPGKSDKEFLILAHLCHPHQFNDDLSGCLVGLALMDHLKRCQSSLQYSYRLLLLPETIGSIAWLSDHLSLVPKLLGGMFLEMTGTTQPLALQRSYFESSQIDKVLSAVMRECGEPYLTGAFRTIVGNDEKQFNAPGIRVPTLSLSRATPESNETTRHFREYHTSADSLENASFENIQRTLDLVIKMTEAIELNAFVSNNFRCEIFLSRYQLFIDKYDDGVGNRDRFNILYDIDGSHTIADICERHQLPFLAVAKFIRKLEELNLVRCTKDEVYDRN